MNDRCPICESTGQEELEVLRGYREGARFNAARCTTCGTAYVVDRSGHDERLYDDIYRNASRITGYQRYGIYRRLSRMAGPLALQALAASEPAFWGVRKQLRGLKKAGRILEVGSGMGYLTHALVHAGYRATGIDVSQEAVAAAIREFGPHYVVDDARVHAQNHAGAYDAVVMTEVVEHLSEPIAFMRDVAHALKPGGRFIVTTPNRAASPPTAPWDTDLPPVHYWWFTEDGMKALGRRLGMRVTFERFERHPERPKWKVPATVPPRRTFITEQGDVVPGSSDGFRDLTMERAAAVALLDAVGVWRWYVRLRHAPGNATVPPTLCAVFWKA